MTERDVERLQREYESLSKDMSDLFVFTQKETTAIRGLLDNVWAKCPYRENIARAVNNVARLERLEQRMEAEAVRTEQRDKELDQRIHAIELSIAKSGALGGMAGGGIVSVIAGIIYGIGKAAGWW